MNQLKPCMVFGTIFVLITGTLAHFVYGFSGDNRLAGLFVPVNESIWEHMKLLFFPMLLFSVFAVVKFQNKNACLIPSLCFGILAGTFLIPVLYYIYTFFVGRSILFVDIAIFIFSTVAAFFAAYKFTLSCSLKPYTVFLCILVGILFVCFLLFTYHPPELAIFSDPTA